MESLLIPIVIGGIILALLMLGLVYSKYYIKSPPDEVTILTGRRKGEVGYRIIRGGATLRWPMIEQVNRMSIAPFKLNLKTTGAYSKEGVPVTLEATALVRFDSSDEAIHTAVQRFLSSQRQEVEESVDEILVGHLRSVAAKMTVEDLNGNREELVRQVTAEAGTDFTKIGMGLDVLTIKHISDEVNYLNALGRKRTADVVAAAEIGEAEARRDAQVKSAAARQAGAEADASADAAIAVANQARDTQVAESRALVESAQQRADQAGPLASAKAKQDVTRAEVEILRVEEEANIAVEQQRVLRETAAQDARVVVPARAEREAAIARSEGTMQAAINTAAGERTRLTEIGEGEAAARTVIAKAFQQELESEAEGKGKLAVSLSAYNQAAMLLTLYPELIKQLPAIMASLASPLGQIDNITMIDSGSGDGAGPLAKFGGTVPMLFAQAIQTLKAVGFDLTQLMPQPATNGTPEVPSAAERVAAAVASLEATAHAPEAAPPVATPTPAESGTPADSPPGDHHEEEERAE